MKYMNMTYTTKTFYGVEFKPGETKEVPGYINAVGFIRTDINVPEKGKKPEIKAAEQVTEVVEAPVEAPVETEAAPKRARKSKGVNE